MPLMPSNQLNGVTDDQTRALFEDGMSQMAYGVLLNKLPNVAPDVATFKILQCDPEEGRGVGAFVVVRSGQTIYIPVVMAESQLKPLDILYYKELNAFLPLTKEWMQELSKMALGELGHGVTAPKSLTSDVDIRGTVIPPNTGRYSYASDASIETMFMAARDQDMGETKLAFLEFLGKAPAAVRKSTASLLEKHANLKDLAVRTYGKTALASALAVTEKVAAAPVKQPGLFIADENTKTAELKDAFGPAAGEAFMGVKVKGYYTKDDRKSVNHAIATESKIDLQAPVEAGAYRLWTTDGKEVLALVTGKPVELLGRSGGVGTRIPPRNRRVPDYKNTAANHSDRFETAPQFTGITAGGHLVYARELAGQALPLEDLKGSAVYKALDGKVSKPGVGDTGVFVVTRGTAIQITSPVTVRSITTSGSVTRIQVVEQHDVYEYGVEQTLILDADGPRGSFRVAGSTGLTYLPSDASFVPAKGKAMREFLKDVGQVQRLVDKSLIEAGAEKISVDFNHRTDCYFVGRTAVYGHVPALRKLATDANIPVEDADALLKQARENPVTFWSLSPVKLAHRIAVVQQKLAGIKDTVKKLYNSDKALHRVQGFNVGALTAMGAVGLRDKLEKRKAAKAEGASEKAAAEAPPEEGMDPNMDPAAQQMAMQPPPPSPVDLAVAEQMQMLQMQGQALQQQMQMLQMVQQRAGMIAGAGPMGSPMGSAAMAAGPMDPSMMGAGAPMDPYGQQGMEQDPYGEQGMDPYGEQGMDPYGEQGMDPSMMGGPQGMEQEQPGMAYMTGEDDSPEAMSQQVNPEFLDAAGQLNDADVFDAATLASMAQNPALKDMVGAYLPSLERSLDNVGRVLLTLWMDEARIKADIGDVAFVSLEDNLRTVFKGMGELILKMNQNTLVMRGPNDPAYRE